MGVKLMLIHRLRIWVLAILSFGAINARAVAAPLIMEPITVDVAAGTELTLEFLSADEENLTLLFMLTWSGAPIIAPDPLPVPAEGAFFDIAFDQPFANALFSDVTGWDLRDAAEVTTTEGLRLFYSSFDGGTGSGTVLVTGFGPGSGCADCGLPTLVALISETDSGLAALRPIPEPNSAILFGVGALVVGASVVRKLTSPARSSLG